MKPHFRLCDRHAIHEGTQVDNVSLCYSTLPSLISLFGAVIQNLIIYIIVRHQSEILGSSVSSEYFFLSPCPIPVSVDISVGLLSPSPNFDSWS